MSEGRILAAEHDGAYAIKLVGDVRVNLCTAVDDYFDQMFANPGLDSALIDLSEAEGVDSTTLGLLAKLALRFRQRFNLKPAIYSSNPGINRLLHSMAFGKLFDIREESCNSADAIADIPTVSANPERAREKVIEAHRVLMDISDDNRERFKDLMAVLEQS